MTLRDAARGTCTLCALAALMAPASVLSSRADDTPKKNARRVNSCFLCAQSRDRGSRSACERVSKTERVCHKSLSRGLHVRVYLYKRGLYTEEMLPDLYSWDLLALRFLDVTSEIIAGVRGKVSEFIAILLLSGGSRGLAISRETEDHRERVRGLINTKMCLLGPDRKYTRFRSPLCVEIVKKGSVGKSCESHLQNTFPKLPLLSLSTL